jgi:hypothetical protein
MVLLAVLLMPLQTFSISSRPRDLSDFGPHTLGEVPKQALLPAVTGGPHEGLRPMMLGAEFLQTGL